MHRALRKYSASFQKSGLEIPHVNVADLIELLKIIAEGLEETDRLLVLKLLQDQASWRLGEAERVEFKNLMVWF